MDIGKSFTFIGEDKDWLTKLVIGALISAVPILNLAWLGYITDLMRNVRAGAALPLPDWSDFGDKFMRGLILGVAAFIYSLPAFLLLCLPLGSILLIAAAPEGRAQEAIGLLTGGASLALVCCLGLYGLAMSMLFPAINLNYAQHGTFGSCFRLGEVWELIRANASNYFTAWIVALAGGFVVTLVIGLISGLIGWIPCIGWVIALALGGVAGAYTGVLYGHLFGQVQASPSQQIVA